MPSQKFARAPLWCALSLALGLAFSSPQADAAGLGRLTIQSGLGQPLRAELEVTSVGRDELPTLQVRLAPLAAFRAANLEFNPALTNLRFALERRPDGTHFVRINSPQVVNEPFLDLMVELTWATGRVIREYTVLLDPPSLRAQPEIVAPTAPTAPATASAPAPAPARPATAAVPTPPAAAAPASPPASTAAPAAYIVKPGDTLGRIAAQNKTSSVSLDQMLVAMFRANPQAFSGNNMNRLKAGATVTIPSESEAAAVAAPAARREVIAQSSDFAQYKSRLARIAEGAPVAAAPSAAAGGGQVTTRVEDKGATAETTGDQLKIARVDDKGAAAAAATRADEATAKARALTEEQERADQLKKTNEAIKKALEVQSKAGAQVQQQTDQKGASAPAPVAAAPAQPAAAEPAKAASAEPATPPPAAAAPAPTAVPAPAPAPQEPSVVADLLGNTTTQLGLAGIAALLAGLFGWSWYRKRKLESADRFSETEGLQANSLFGATGGQSVDTGTSTFNSSFIPAASQLDSNEVDPVAEADVYIAYGREEQAEDILKEALRLQPDRHAVRVKLLEIYARRGDKSMFMTIVEDLRSRTGAEGEDWERAVKLGRTLDPGHAMFAGGPSTELGRTATTAFRFDSTTRSGSPSTIGGGPTTGLDLSGLTANSASVKNEAPSAPPLTRMVVDTRMSDTTMSADTKMPTESRLTGPESVSAPTTQFHATLPGGQPANTISAPAAPATDFGSLDFDLGPTKINFGPTTRMPETESGATQDDDEDDFLAAASAPKAQPPVSPDTTGGPGNKYPAMLPTATGIGMIPDLDLNIPSTRMPVPDPEPEPEPVVSAAYTRAAEPLAAVEALSRPTVIGAMKSPGVNTMVGAGWRDDAAARLTANTDQATVPLIDFDLSAVAQDSTRRGETEPGSALAQQMATKLDLARGYIDLGVKDGARELVDEVVRDGTKEQRQAAVELIKQLES